MKATIFSNFVVAVEDKSLIVITKHILEGTYKSEIEEIQSLFAQDKLQEAEEKKKHLLAFTPSATFKGGRKAELLVEYSRCIVLDIDDLAEADYNFAFDKAKFCPHTFCCFRSPGGKGFKILVFVNTGAEHHELAYNQLADFYEQLMNVKIDRSGKDTTRLCFMSYDPSGHKNINSTDFIVQLPTVTVAAEHQPAQLQSENNGDASNAKYAKLFQKQVNYTEKKISFVNGNRNNFIHYLSCNCNRAGIPQDVALQLILDRFNYDEKEVRATTRSGYENNLTDFAQFANSASTTQTKEEQEEEFTEQLSSTPFIPDEVFPTLPQLLQDGCNVFRDKRERDIFLTSALTILSGCFTAIKGVYDGRTVFPNLFCFIIAPPASGKSALTFAKKLADGIHNQLFQESKELKAAYEIELEQFKTAKRQKKKGEVAAQEEPPAQPKFKVLFIPANSSTAAVMYHLDQAEGIGIFCETEADTMVNAFKQDWSGYSDLLRKAFQHETLSSSRKTNHEYIMVPIPRLSCALSGTPSQVLGLIASAEDGLFSRILFYVFKSESEWRDVFNGNGVNLTDHFDALSKKVFDYASFLNKNETVFSFTEEQKAKFQEKFRAIHDEIKIFVSEDATSSVKRLGLCAFRTAMVLSVLRNGEEGVIENSITCSDADFNTALVLADVYLQHAMLMFKSLPKSSHTTLDNRIQKFYESLPVGRDFPRHEAVSIGSSLNIAERTVGKYLKKLLGTYLSKSDQYGTYRKL